MEKLTHQEEEIMLVIWKKKRGIIKDFLEQLPEPQPPYTTVASIVKNLEKKGFLSSEKIGNTYLYIPRITQTEYKKKFLSGIVKSYFSNSYKEMVTFFAHEQKLPSKSRKSCPNFPAEPKRCSLLSKTISNTRKKLSTNKPKDG